MPNSSQFVLPMIFAPEAFSSRTTVASKGDWKSLSKSTPGVESAFVRSGARDEY